MAGFRRRCAGGSIPWVSVRPKEVKPGQCAALCGKGTDAKTQRRRQGLFFHEPGEEGWLGDKFGGNQAKAHILLSADEASGISPFSADASDRSERGRVEPSKDGWHDVGEKNVEEGGFHSYTGSKSPSKMAASTI